LETYAKASDEDYKTICADLMIREDYPTASELDGGTAIGGLDVFTKALVCGVEGCSKLFASGGSMKNHYDTVHGIKAPTQYNIAAAQRLDKNHHKVFFRVIPPSDIAIPSLDNDWITKLDSEIRDTMQEVNLEAIDPRYINALLKKTRWMEHVRGHEPAELRSLVTLPAADEIPMLREVVMYIVDVAMNMTNHAQPTLLQLLNTKNPAE